MEKEAIMTNIEEACIRCLDYFGIFKYPLTADEIHQFNTVKSSREEVETGLTRLQSKSLIFKIGDFFLTENNQDWVDERLQGNERAFRLLEESGKYVRIIASFPFVSGIAISGSLSKFYASEHTDIDYFIITGANRLWIARTLLHLFKKLTFITGHQHYFCMNYFVDTNALEITHPNLYSAIETVTLLPVYNTDIIKRFTKENVWTKNYLPNYSLQDNLSYLVEHTKKPFKRFAEDFINLLAPQKLNRFFMKLTDRKWRRKWRGHCYSEEEYNRAFQTEISISKNHPVDYEKKVLNALAGNTE